MNEWEDKTEYIQIIELGHFGVAIWSFPNRDTSFPSAGYTFEKAVEEAFKQGYRPVCAYKEKFIMRNTNL